MTWDPSRPSNDEKIRNMGQNVFRPFWDAIEQASENASENKLRQWGVNLIDRSTVGGASLNPPEIEDTGTVYVRDDGAHPELFFRDTQGNFVQITKDGSLGSATGAVFNSVSFNGNDFMIIRWANYSYGVVGNSDAFIKQGGTEEFDTPLTGISTSGSDPNQGTNVSVTFSTPMPGIYSVMATPKSGTIRVYNVGPSGFSLNIRTPQGGFISPNNTGGVHLMVVGTA